MDATDHHARKQLADPATPAEALADIAYDHPHLRPQIEAHPNVYPGLLEWLTEYGLPLTPVPTEVAVVPPAQRHAEAEAHHAAHAAAHLARVEERARAHHAREEERARPKTAATNLDRSAQPVAPVLPAGVQPNVPAAYPAQQLPSAGPLAASAVPSAGSSTPQAPASAPPVMGVAPAAPATTRFDRVQSGVNASPEGQLPNAGPATTRFPSVTHDGPRRAGVPDTGNMQLPSFEKLLNQPHTAPFTGQQHVQTGKGQPQVSPDAPMNVYAVLAIIFCLGWLGIVFGLIAKSKIRATGERGWALAHWGIILGTTFTVLAVLGVAAVFVLGLLGFTNFK